MFSSIFLRFSFYLFSSLAICVCCVCVFKKKMDNSLRSAFAFLGMSLVFFSFFSHFLFSFLPSPLQDTLFATQNKHERGSSTFQRIFHFNFCTFVLHIFLNTRKSKGTQTFWVFWNGTQEEKQEQQTKLIPRKAKAERREFSIFFWTHTHTHTNRQRRK